MTVKIVARILMAAGALAVLGAAQSATAATEVESYSTGLRASITIDSQVGAEISPVGYAFGTSPPNASYQVDSSLASFDSSGSLGAGSFTTSAGMMNDTASGSFSPLFSTATSTVTALDSGLSLSLGPVFHVAAKSLSSTSTTSDVSGLMFAGSSTIDSLDISGSLFSSDIVSNVDAMTPANTVLYNSGGLAFVVNYQTPYFDLNKPAGVQTSALTVILNNFAFGGDLLTGYIEFANSTVTILDAPVYLTPSFNPFASSVPEPETWAMMLVGLGVAGAAMRRQNKMVSKSGPAPLPA